MMEQCRLDFERITNVHPTDDEDTTHVTAWCWTHRRYCQGLADTERLAEFGHMIGDEREPLEMAEAED